LGKARRDQRRFVEFVEWTVVSGRHRVRHGRSRRAGGRP
jgi:hypothetical protein